MSLTIFTCISGMFLACAADISKDQSEIAYIHETLSNQALVTERLTHSVSELTIDNVNLKRRADQLESELRNGLYTNAVKTRTNGFSRNKRFVLNDEDGDSLGPAFTAKLSQHVTGLGSHQPIVFDYIESNFGDAYSPITGIFTSPTNGTYFFFTSLLSHTDEKINAEIVKNGIDLAPVYSHGNQRLDQGANAAVTRLNAGDKVWVRNLENVTQRVFGDYWSTFSGFQI